MRYAARKDTTQGAIVAALRGVGAKVLILDRFDLLIHFRGKLMMLDCKTAVNKSGGFRKKPSQVQLERDGWPLKYATSAQEAVALVLEQP